MARLVVLGSGSFASPDEADVDRDFNEVDLREMLEQASGYREDVLAGRWVVETRHAGRLWEVIVEPDPDEAHLVVVTAYPVS